jgi:hypothetical protein
MTLEMRDRCERCAAALAHTDPACICSYECTFCLVCGEDMKFVCPNCEGELVHRPRRST